MEMSSTHRADQRSSGRGVRPLTEYMRRVLQTALLKDDYSVTAAASHFSISRRTLARHLRAEGCTFRQVSNEVRFEIACKLLAKTDLSLRQIAEVLNYAELSAFTRAFRRWSGQTPSAWRNSHRR